jgi:hypothetical protein
VLLVDVDDQPVTPVGAELEGRLRLEQPRAVAGGQPDVDRLGRGVCRLCGEETAKQQRGGDDNGKETRR